MPLLAESLVLAAVGTSARNRRGTLAQESYELLGVVNRLTQQLFVDASVANPFYIGASFDMAYQAAPLNGWARPAGMLSVLRIESTSGGAPTTPGMPSGTEIAVVAPDDRGAAEHEPSIVELGGRSIPTTCHSPALLVEPCA